MSQNVGRKPSITVRGSSWRRHAPTLLEQWRRFSPRYARFYKGLAELLRLGTGRGGTDLLARRSGIGKHKVRPMLEGAKVLGFVTEITRDRDGVLKEIELQTLPPIRTVSVKKVQQLEALGVPLLHGNHKSMSGAALARLRVTIERDARAPSVAKRFNKADYEDEYEASRKSGAFISHTGQHGPDCNICAGINERKLQG